MPEQLFYAQLFGRVVLHDQKPFSARSRILLDPIQRQIEAIRRSRLGEKCEGAAGQSVLPVFVQGQHLYRNVPGGRVLLQMVEDGPSKHVRQEYVQRYSSRMILASQCERLRPS